MATPKKVAFVVGAIIISQIHFINARPTVITSSKVNNYFNKFKPSKHPVKLPLKPSRQAYTRVIKPVTSPPVTITKKFNFPDVDYPLVSTYFQNNVNFISEDNLMKKVCKDVNLTSILCKHTNNPFVPVKKQYCCQKIDLLPTVDYPMTVYELITPKYWNEIIKTNIENQGILIDTFTFDNYEKTGSKGYQDGIEKAVQALIKWDKERDKNSLSQVTPKTPLDNGVSILPMPQTTEEVILPEDESFPDPLSGDNISNTIFSSPVDINEIVPIDIPVTDAVSQMSPINVLDDEVSILPVPQTMKEVVPMETILPKNESAPDPLSGDKNSDTIPSNPFNTNEFVPKYIPVTDEVNQLTPITTLGDGVSILPMPQTIEEVVPTETMIPENESAPDPIPANIISELGNPVNTNKILPIDIPVTDYVSQVSPINTLDDEGSILPVPQTIEEVVPTETMIPENESTPDSVPGDMVSELIPCIPTNTNEILPINIPDTDEISQVSPINTLADEGSILPVPQTIEEVLPTETIIPENESAPDPIPANIISDTILGIPVNTNEILPIDIPVTDEVSQVSPINTLYDEGSILPVPQTIEEVVPPETMIPKNESTPDSVPGDMISELIPCISTNTNEILPIDIPDTDEVSQVMPINTLDNEVSILPVPQTIKEAAPTETILPENMLTSDALPSDTILGTIPSNPVNTNEIFPIDTPVTDTVSQVTPINTLDEGVSILPVPQRIEEAVPIETLPVNIPSTDSVSQVTPISQLDEGISILSINPTIAEIVLLETLLPVNPLIPGLLPGDNILDTVPGSFVTDEIAPILPLDSSDILPPETMVTKPMSHVPLEPSTSDLIITGTEVTKAMPIEDTSVIPPIDSSDNTESPLNDLPTTNVPLDDINDSCTILTEDIRKKRDIEICKKESLLCPEDVDYFLVC